ncbi:MAG TPA: hypothetical protein VKV05_01665 [Terriglobales bacterium]|nr:hypothetical protein [Terriglobales bacterium]
MAKQNEVMQSNFDHRRELRRRRDGGYLLLGILLMLAFMVITLAYVVAPRMVQQMKRDREEEMIHRGTQYMRAIKRYYAKNGAYPNSLDDLDKGQVRYLRKRYKDPLTKDGQWKLLYYSDIAMLMNGAAPGTPAAALASQGGAMTPGGAIAPGGSAPVQGGFGAALQQQQLQAGLVGGFAMNSGQGYSPQGAPGSVGGFSADSGQGYSPQNTPGSVGGFSAGSDQGNNSAGGPGSNNPSGSSQPGSSPFVQSGPGANLPGGGGPLVGVASKCKDATIRVFNKQTKYDEWQFIYNPMMDTGTTLLRGPYQPTTISGAQIGTPASQMNGQPGASGQQPGGFGQQSPFGQQPGGFNQPQNAPQQMMQPGGSFPPELNQPQ